MSENLSKSDIKRLTNQYFKKQGKEFIEVKEKISDAKSIDLLKSIWEKLNVGRYSEEKYKDFFTLFSNIEKRQINNLLISRTYLTEPLLDQTILYMNQSGDSFFTTWLSECSSLDFYRNYFILKTIHILGSGDDIAKLVKKVNFYYYDPDEHKTQTGGIIPIIIKSSMQVQAVQNNLRQISMLALSPMLPIEIVDTLHPLVQKAQLLFRRSIFIVEMCKKYGTEKLESLWMNTPNKNNHEEKIKQFEINLFISYCLINLGIKSQNSLNLILEYVNRISKSKQLYISENLYSIFAYEFLVKYYLFSKESAIRDEIIKGIQHPNTVISNAVSASILYNNVEDLINRISLHPTIYKFEIHPIAVNAILYSNDFSRKLLWQTMEDENKEIREFASMNEKMILDQINEASA